jgi:transcription elongation factor SPT6
MKRSIYGFILSPEDPGSFMLIYKHPNNSPRQEAISVQPDGYIFRKMKFPTIDLLLQKWQEMEKSRAAGGGQTRPQSSSNSSNRPPSGYPQQTNSRRPDDRSRTTRNY